MSKGTKLKIKQLRKALKLAVKTRENLLTTWEGVCRAETCICNRLLDMIETTKLLETKISMQIEALEKELT